MTVIAIQVLYIIAYIINGYKFRIWMPFSLIGSAIGAFLLFSSPTYHTRSEMWKHSYLEIAIAALKKIKPITINAMRYLIVAITVTLLMLAIFLYTSKKHDSVKAFVKENKTKLSLFLIYILAFAIWIYSACLCDYFPKRTYSNAVAIITIAAITLVADLKPLKSKNLIIDVSTVLLCMALTVGGVLPSYFDIKLAKQQYDQRIVAIEEAKKNGQKVIELAPIKCETKQCAYFDGGDIAKNEYYMTTQQADYYGFDEIIVIDND